MSNGIVQVQLIGGFGNQLHQYCAARAYAEEIGAKLEVPAGWLGIHAFEVPESPYTCELSPMNDGNCGGDPALSIIANWGKTDIRLGGYFQSQNWIDKLSKAKLQSWLKVRPFHLARCPRPRYRYAAAHLRQGDYINHPLFANITRESYVVACAEHGITEELIWIEQDQAAPGYDQPIPFLPDFLRLMQADVLLRANSTFSWWAGALSNGVVYSPVVDDHVGKCDVKFVKGNWPRIAHTDRVGVIVTDLHLPD